MRLNDVFSVLLGVLAILFLAACDPAARDAATDTYEDAKVRVWLSKRDSMPEKEWYDEGCGLALDSAGRVLSPYQYSQLVHECNRRVAGDTLVQPN